MVRKMTLQVEIKTNYRFGVLVLEVLQVAAASGEKDGRKGGWIEGAREDVDGRGGSELLEAPVKISGPLGDQLSSITRRIQLQREAERIQHRSVTH